MEKVDILCRMLIYVSINIPPACVHVKTIPKQRFKNLNETISMFMKRLYVNCVLYDLEKSHIYTDLQILYCKGAGMAGVGDEEGHERNL